MTDKPRLAIVEGYLDVIVRKYWRVEDVECHDEDDARDAAVAIIWRNGYSDYLDYDKSEEEIDFSDCEAEMVDLVVNEYVAVIEVYLEAATEQDAKDTIADLMTMNYCLDSIEER